MRQIRDEQKPMTHDTRPGMTRRGFLRRVGNTALGVALGTAAGLGAVAGNPALAGPSFALPARSVRGDRARKGWSAANVSVTVMTADVKAVRQVDAARYQIMDAVEELVASQGPRLVEPGAQAALRRQIADLVQRVAPEGSVTAVSSVGLSVYR